MDVAKIPIGREPPYDINVIVEIAQGGNPVKYELDKASGAVFVDRFFAYGDVLSGQLRLCATHTRNGRHKERERERDNGKSVSPQADPRQCAEKDARGGRAV
jgi:hypothetical protein